MAPARSIVDIAWVEVPPGEPRRAHAWRLVRTMLPADAALSNPCPRCGGPHGAVVVAHVPFLAGVTYAGGYAIAAVAATQDAAALGVDAEPEHDARRDAAGMSGVLGDDEASVREWIRVEAALKADGRGLRVEPSTVVVAPTADGWTATVPDGEVYAGWDAAGPPGILVSVAVLSPGSQGV
ncbi:chemotaxis protein CheY [Microbacterium sp. NPDC058062]|uniref:chemotaxis protein CheY n=1 Tax=Microbacterium sp. NPDC058062 TaxID=3346320 RepID=UPI0036D8FAE8